MKKISCLLLVALCMLSGNLLAASAPPSDVRVSPMLTTTWGQTLEPANYTSGTNLACFNYYTPDSTGYPPTTAGNVNNYPTGCVATGMAQVMNYHQWAVSRYPFGSRFSITVDGTTYPNPSNPTPLALKGGTLGGNFDWLRMQDIATDPLARQEVGRLMHDLGIALSMNYYSWASNGSGTDFDYIDNVFMNFTYSNAATLEGNIYKNGVLTAQSIPTTQAEIAITTNLDAGLPVLIGVNDNTLSSGHVLVIDGYGIDTSGTLWYHWNFGLPVQGTGYPSVTNLGWYTLPAGVGSSTATSAGYDVLDGIALNLFKSIPPAIPMGEIISGRIIDPSGAPLSGIQIDITCPMNPAFVPVTVYTNSNGIFAAYGTIVSNQTYIVTASGTGYITKVNPNCIVGTTAKQWIVTNYPAPGDGYYQISVGNVRSDMTLSPGITLPTLPICDMNEFTGLAKYWQNAHSQITAPDIRYDYNGDWNVDMQDFHHIVMAWLMTPVEFRTQFDVMFDTAGPMPANYPWQYAGSGGAWTVVDIPLVAAESPNIGDGQSTSFKLPVKMFTGMPGTVDINFMLDCDTEMGADVFSFLVDGTPVMELGGQTAFSGQLNQMLNYQLTGVTFGEVKTLEWRYTKDAANSAGADTVWISQIMISAQP